MEKGRNNTALLKCSRQVGGMGSEQEYHEFKSLCCSAYNILRKHASLILNLLVLMIDAKIPDISGKEGTVDPKTNIAKVQEKFRYTLFCMRSDEGSLHGVSHFWFGLCPFLASEMRGHRCRYRCRHRHWHTHRQGHPCLHMYRLRHTHTHTHTRRHRHRHSHSHSHSHSHGRMHRHTGLRHRHAHAERADVGIGAGTGTGMGTGTGDQQNALEGGGGGGRRGPLTDDLCGMGGRPGPAGGSTPGPLLGRPGPSPLIPSTPSIPIPEDGRRSGTDRGTPTPHLLLSSPDPDRASSTLRKARGSTSLCLWCPL